MERARKLLEKLNATTPEFREMGKKVITRARTSKITTYGDEMLPAGPEININEEIIVVEGRADIVNLLRYGIKNTIAMNGTVIPRTIKDLSLEKKVTLFVDGDRGGILIIKDAINNINLDSITKAPDGKEVEELTEKEVLVCLRNKASVEDFIKKYKIRITRTPRRTTRRETRGIREIRKPIKKPISMTRPASSVSAPTISAKPAKETEEERDFFQQVLEELTGTKGAALIIKTSEGLKTIYKASSSKIIDSLYNFRKRHGGLHALIIDDIATIPIIRTAEKLNCKFLVARNFATTRTNIKLISL